MLHSDLLEHPKLRHGFFTRQGGISRGVYTSLNCGPGSADDPAHVVENRRRVVERLAEDLISTDLPLCSLYQVHGPAVVHVTAPWDAANRPEADAMVTDRPGIALGILTADCTPVLFADPQAGVVGAAHAGWKGALYGVLGATITAMERLGASRSRIQAAIGPTIAQESYEVSAAFRATFLEQDPGHARFFVPGRDSDHAQFDLPGFVAARLLAEGIGGLDDLKLDTYADSRRFFSFRRTTHHGEADYGRQISAIMVAPI
ncbi:peptidoglycan editing factor PgeF [Govanella unica]|uniref:Purine nucleoside phosphorylase n=1 Tax=Govanella unica TaxID=2975056 RepID=A0A9X3Z851_9PROT|nr:peptidoglycan editing factor PgeF [Govania unica]MDA5194776.1 peptidoglycan editing factor PgeF [Govania unica]